MSRLGLAAMRPRDPRERHRVSTPLELFFDLVFVVAVSLSSGQLHASETSDHIVSGVGSYLMVFFAVWWAWVNFAWFASAFDVDDWLYRVTTIVQMGGALVLAAGTRSAMADQDYTVITIGYVIMRLAMVSQWMRAGRDPSVRATAHRFALGIAVVQLLWLMRLALPEQGGVWAFLVLVALELVVPPWAEAKGTTPWHAGHISERYSLFTIIVLGESVLASTIAVVDAIDAGEDTATLVVVAVCGLVLAAGMWWIYFARVHHAFLTSFRRALIFGYGHYFVFAAAGAFSAGISVAIAYDTDETSLDAAAAAATLTVPVAVFVLVVWAVGLRPWLPRRANVAVPVLAVSLGAAALIPFSLPVAAATIVAIVTVLEASGVRSDGLPQAVGDPTATAVA